MNGVWAGLAAVGLFALAPAGAQAQGDLGLSQGGGGGVVEDRLGGIAEDRPGAGLDQQQLGRAPVGLGALDQDGDNVISRDEFTTARPGEPRMFQVYDADQDNRVSLDEFIQRRQALQERRFSRLDVDGDGFVTEQDIAQRRGAVFDNLDRNGDDVLSADELRRPGRGMQRR